MIKNLEMAVVKIHSQNGGGLPRQIPIYDYLFETSFLRYSDTQCDDQGSSWQHQKPFDQMHIYYMQMVNAY